MLGPRPDRKSTRLNSSHLGISYAVFCLKKKKIKTGIALRHTGTSAGGRPGARSAPRVVIAVCPCPHCGAQLPCFMLFLFFVFFLRYGAPPESSPFPHPPLFRF